MSYNILGIHPGHNGSAALISDGKLIYYLEEERLSREKYDGNPFRVMSDIFSKYKVNKLVIGGTNDISENIVLPLTSENPYACLARKYNPNIEVIIMNQHHHILHSLIARFKSGFKECAILIIDGAGTQQPIEVSKGIFTNGYEAETILLSKDKFDFKSLYKSYGGDLNNSFKNDIIIIDSTSTIVRCYEGISHYLGFHPLEAGKTMGMSSYGKFNSNIPKLFKNGRGNKSVFINRYPQHPIIDVENNPIFQDKDKIKADLAWHIQNETQNEVVKLIQKTINLSKLNKICVVGGYGLNCVNNYFLKKTFPNTQIYHEPISHDGGTAIGAAIYGWVSSKKEIPIVPNTLYLGPKYTINQYLKILKSYNNMFNQYKITPEQIAKLISKRNIVCIFQGRSEAGPRALGNRSILYDPTDPNGKDFVNKVKKREWFRPFAGTVLLEKANEWFDMAGLEESPFMMYAMDVWPDKQEQIKAITHVDGTCRIQTVTEEQNPHYYKLIQEFEKITGVPILFNTSFNLAGDPLVETIEDALETILKSELKYLYLPELEMLLEKK